MTRAKRCSRCGLTKVLECFYFKTRAKRGKGWLDAECKDCHRIIARESSRRRSAEKKAHAVARKREWREVHRSNREQELLKQRLRMRRYRRAAREERAWYLRRSA